MKLSLALALSGASTAAAADCKATTIDFLVLDGDATFAAVEDDIRANLAEVGRCNSLARSEPSLSPLSALASRGVDSQVQGHQSPSTSSPP